MCVKLSPEDLNPCLCLLHPTNTYICGVTIASRVCSSDNLVNTQVAFDIDLKSQFFFFFFTIQLIFTTIYGSHCTFWYYSQVIFYYFSYILTLFIVFLAKSFQFQLDKLFPNGLLGCVWIPLILLKTENTAAK